jgi:hypothetical protein
MADHITLKRNGGWTIELSSPVGTVTELDIQPCSLDHTIRWARGDIPSVLALLAELTGVKESILKKLTGQDSDRVFIAFSFIVSGQIKKDFEQGTRPLATPPELMTGAQKYEEIDSQVDEVDPRFPKVDGPVQRFSQPPQVVETGRLENESENFGGSIDVSAPDVMKRAG